MYDEFNKGNNASGHGERIQVLIDHFERSSQGERIGDAHDKIGAVRYFLKNGLVDAVDTLGNKINNPRTAYTIGRMQPNQKGLDYLHQKRIGVANTIASVSGTFLGKFLKSFFGR
jgi:hypothetical protein